MAFAGPIRHRGAHADTEFRAEHGLEPPQVADDNVPRMALTSNSTSVLLAMTCLAAGSGFGAGGGTFAGPVMEEHPVRTAPHHRSVPICFRTAGTALRRLIIAHRQ